MSEGVGLTVAALTQGAEIPSTRFRWKQYVPDLEARGFRVKEFTARFGAYAPPSLSSRVAWLPAALGESLMRTMAARRQDLCFLQRNLIATLCSFEPLLRQPMIFDVDDAIFLGPRGASAGRIARHANVTICGNSFLADHFCQFGSVETLPTGVDTDYFSPRPGAAPNRPVIGWSGSSSGFPYLYGIESALQHVLALHPDAVLKVVADHPPAFASLPKERVRFERWSADAEVDTLRGFTVGLMPLDDTPWARGKCSFKMLTYMAVGIPVVVSPVGMNSEVLAFGTCGFAARSPNDWVDAISTCIRSKAEAEEMGRVGRQVAETYFARNVLGPKLAGILATYA